MAYQLSFQLHECAHQELIGKVDANITKIGTEIEAEVFKRIRSILGGNEATLLHQQFLVKCNHTDIPIIGKIKESVRMACAHNATLIANGLMHMGTTSDVFLRDNLQWISNATNWNKFNAVASLGLIHKVLLYDRDSRTRIFQGNEANAKKVLEPYLPGESEPDAYRFKEGGAFYAYGKKAIKNLHDDIQYV